MSSDEIKNSNNTDDVTLFTEQEMYDFVKGFLIAYANNKIQVDFLKHVNFSLDENGNKLYSEEDVLNDKKWNDGLQESIDIIVGTKPASSDVKRQMIKEMFSNIFNYKMNDWLEGSFYDFVLERKLIDLEKKISEHDKTINEYVAHLKEQSGI